MVGVFIELSLSTFLQLHEALSRNTITRLKTYTVTMNKVDLTKIYFFPAIATTTLIYIRKWTKLIKMQLTVTNISIDLIIYIIIISSVSKINCGLQVNWVPVRLIKAHSDSDELTCMLKLKIPTKFLNLNIYSFMQLMNSYLINRALMRCILKENSNNTFSN